MPIEVESLLTILAILVFIIMMVAMALSIHTLSGGLLYSPSPSSCQIVEADNILEV